MKLLIVTASLPYPPASGGAIRTYGIIKGLYEAGHQITLLSFGEGDAAQTPLATFCTRIEIIPPPVRSKFQRIWTLFFSSQADIETRFYSDAFAERLFALVDQQDYDLIQFEAIESACYLPLVKSAYPEIPICFDTFNAEADLQRVIFEIDRQEIKRWPAALYSYIQSKRIKRYEGDLCRMADLVIAVSEEDHALLSQYCEDDRTKILQSGIFVDDYAQPETHIELAPNTLVFTGKMDYRPNVDAMLWFCERIFPQIDEAQLVIVGQKPHPRIAHLAEQDKITLTGWVDTIPPYLHAATVYIAPLRMGSGTRLKILEAMASGCAIVATPTAAAGLSREVKSALVIADSEASFAEAINTLLVHPEQRKDYGLRARQMVSKHYDWSVLIPRLLQAYEEVGLG